MSNDAFMEETPLETKQRSGRKQKDSAEKMEEEVRAFQSDESKMAREIITLRKELSRLHYKVKSYQERNRSLQIISTTIILILLSVITYKVFTAV